MACGDFLIGSDNIQVSFKRAKNLALEGPFEPDFGPQNCSCSQKRN